MKYWRNKTKQIKNKKIKNRNSIQSRLIAQVANDTVTTNNNSKIIQSMENERRKLELQLPNARHKLCDRFTAAIKSKGIGLKNKKSH